MGAEWHQASGSGSGSGPGTELDEFPLLANHSRIATTMSIRLPKSKITAMIWPKPHADSPGLIFERLRWTWILGEYDTFLFFDNRNTTHDQLEGRNTIRRVS
jgi:hypothetical protein